MNEFVFVGKCLERRNTIKSWRTKCVMFVVMIVNTVVLVLLGWSVGHIL